jgi:hypothetical protein
MAESDTTSPEYKEVLRLLILLSSSVNFITLRLKEISSNKVLTPDYLDQLTAVTQEVDKYVSKDNPL